MTSNGGGGVCEFDMLGALRFRLAFDHDPLTTLVDNENLRDHCGLGTHGKALDNLHVFPVPACSSSRAA